MKIYFFCYPQGPPDKAGYQHQTVVLAEGLRELGIKFSSNLNYWKITADSDEYLLKEEQKHHYEDFDVVVVSSMFYYYKREDLLPANLFKSKRSYKLVFIDSSDGQNTPGYRPEIRYADLVLKSYYCSKYSYPYNFTPWQFGLSRRIISSLVPLPFADRNNDVLVNYRVEHSVRMLAERTVMETVYKTLYLNSEIDVFDEIKFSRRDKLYWEQSGRRHYPEYYKRLGASKACAAFGGRLQNSFTVKQNFLSKLVNRVDDRYHILTHDRILQYDSWRFWESLASGCVTLHADLEKYGAILPVMPKNGKHYIGIDFSDLNNSLKRVEELHKYEEIGFNGRKWVLEHYSPEKIAKRFLNLIELI